MIILRVGSPCLLMAGFGTRDGGSAFYRRQSSRGFRRVVDEVTASPFGTPGETSEETGPGENCSKRKKSENEDGCVEDEANVVEVACLSNGWNVSGGGGGGVGGGLGVVAAVGVGHLDLTPPGLGRQGCLVL